nr:uncharacterized protein LOC100202177 [Hydra vulgaris]
MKNTKVILSTIFLNCFLFVSLYEVKESSKNKVQFTSFISMSHNALTDNKTNIKSLYEKVEQSVKNLLNMKQKALNEKRNKRSQLNQNEPNLMCTEKQIAITNENGTYEIVMKFNSKKVDYFKLADFVISKECVSKSTLPCKTKYETRKYAKLNISGGTVSLIGNIKQLEVGICCQCF